jgi:hypothetical protein
MSRRVRAGLSIWAVATTALATLFGFSAPKPRRSSSRTTRRSRVMRFRLIRSQATPCSKYSSVHRLGAAP